MIQAAPPSLEPYRPSLLGGALPLDFTNTVSGRGTEWSWERLTSRMALADWAFHAGEIDRDRHARLRGAANAAESVPEAAIVLREALHAIVRAVIAGQEPAEADTAILRDCAIRGMQRGAFVPAADGRFGWQIPSADSDFDWLLGRIALHALDMFRESDPSRFRCCPAKDCGFLFYDRSKNGSRRWCDMAVCGNRAKARTFRGRMISD